MQFQALCKPGSVMPLRQYGRLFTKTMLVMKLTAIILLAGFLHATPGVYSKTVTLTVKNVPLTKIFREIQRQTSYRVIYKKTDLQMITTVNLQARTASI